MFLKKGGRVAAVLPLTTFTAKSFHNYIRFALENYTVEAIFVGLGRAARARAMIACRSEDRSIKKETDRLYFINYQGSNIVFKDRVTDSNYLIPASIVKPAIRRFSYFTSLDITGKAGFCITKITKDVEKIIEDLYGKKEAVDIIKQGRLEWEKLINRGSAKLCMMWRLDWGASGTTLICVRNDQPVFLVIKGKYFHGISKEVYEKLLCLWFNSSAFILSFLGRARITRGTYMDLEEYALDLCPVPDIGSLSRDDCKFIDELWDNVSKINVPYLLEQLETNHPFRNKLDDGLLQLCGIKDKQERQRLSDVFRKGASVAINKLMQTMGNS